MTGNKSEQVVFKKSAGEDLEDLLFSSIEQDTSGIPLLISIQKFMLKETGTIHNRKAKFDFVIKFFRIINEKRYELYEATAKPELQIHGVFKNAHEKNVTETFKQIIKNFNEYIITHQDLPPLADSVIVVYRTDLNPETNEKSDTISWNENYKLKWKDFKGSSNNSPFMAESNCVFTYSARPVSKPRFMELHIDLRACFERNSSWFRKGQETDILLAHEQLHFDICELNIRKLRNKISQYQFNPMEYDKEIKLLFDSAWSEYQLEQQLYDSETEHGIVDKMQQKWQSDIKNQLGTSLKEGNKSDSTK